MTSLLLLQTPPPITRGPLPTFGPVQPRASDLRFLLDVSGTARVVLHPRSLLPLMSQRRQSHDTQRLYFITELSLFSEQVINMETAFKTSDHFTC